MQRIKLTVTRVIAMMILIKVLNVKAEMRSKEIRE